MKNFPFCLLIVVAIASCGQHDHKAEVPAKDSTAASYQKAEVDETVVPPYFTVIGDSLEIPSVEIELALSDKANEKLRTAKETVIVAAYFSGEPRDTTSEEYLESGQFGVASHIEELREGRVARIQQVKISRGMYDSLANKDIELLINVYSGRRSTDVNILHCDILQDRMSVLKGGRYVLKGKLIGEQ